ncbi:MULTISPECIES: 16S rRNA (cytosine(1402)-N(4))-methyltransferase RsmH [Treponema]|uniref:Ribosomal RNA small subunit methyltransferase H n=1 Tax=Treponema rectale TaxID=744512 RepID=A0A840SEJ3_9SPIR|nr:16S rRNA (cytosine(1402)-N(4))-methyltransferase RsmH [Treponema sp.]MBB5217983.1 16S rRNA (cytosine1402-N4)-methyltransferase [Treponema rectale]MBE6353510.1 16S rRNA (cytosine(1402)-N(4))-methyltransferase RsmH [Treponema sp.]MBO6176549.1 16S rRNA (cytosine(1402)-N(4))-methyltransferase RsmH [Treponema sp.]QOS40301.1 16S rRNA (cytosine(1402)-N(4))-methyltransferase [Treponema rectale]
MEIVHTPVLLNECLEYLSPEGEPFERDAFMIDSTLGEGGHSFNFLSKYPGLSIMGVDADSTIQSRARERLSPFSSRMQFYNGWFNDFYADYPLERHPDIILFDLGISVFHYERSGRGFSFRHDEELDMRLNPSAGESAADIVNSYEEKKLADMIYLYSDEKYSRRIAAAIVEARRGGKILSTKALADIIYEAVPSKYRHGNIHPATRTFQALRIQVNSELKRLVSAIHNAFNVLNPGGKLGVITFHSLEDRIVKNYFRNLGKQCVCPPEVALCRCEGHPCAQIITRKPLEPTEEEVKQNSPSRSAKLRVVRKICDAGQMRLEGVEAL